jgi:two-component system, chemotaxis family, CheB/CheR fusion protein
MSSTVEGRFDNLLEYLRRSRGFDFTGYKRPSLIRRVGRRMQMAGMRDFGDYTDYLEVHPEEFARLFNHLLINVTSFFRDPACWDYLARHVIPKIVASRKRGEPIRVWSAGCASGEETYTLAILFVDALGRENFKTRVKIYASDVDEEALAQARQATYTTRDLQAVPPKLRKKHFVPADGRFSFDPELRRSVIFGRHDLVQDAPISRLDLLVCRNTLMYFNAETQARILARFHFALNETGFLFLGKAEMMLQLGHAFKPVQVKHRIFARASQAHLRDRLLVLANANGAETVQQISRQVRLRELAFEKSAVPQIILDTSGVLLSANDRARAVCGVTPQDIGRPVYDLEISHRPVELRPFIERACKDKQKVEVERIEHRPGNGGDHRGFDISVEPLIDDDGACLGVSLVFADVTGSAHMHEDLQRTQQELATSHEEQQSTSEELETTNEELQSTNEELETTNEELQSTNEELETMNEELQSSNEELETVNEELRERTDEIDRSNTFMTSILGSLRAGVIVLDRGLKVAIWNRRAEDLWGLRPEEVLGHPFLGLDMGLPTENLTRPIRSVLLGVGDPEPIVIDAVNRRGQKFSCEVRFAPLIGVDRERQGVILFLDGK